MFGPQRLGMRLIGEVARKQENLKMKITTTEIQNIMQEFYHQNQRHPNAILIPAGADSIDGITPAKLESLFCMKVVYAAVPEIRVAILWGQLRFKGLNVPGVMEKSILFSSFIQINKPVKEFYDVVAAQLQISARSYTNILKVALTISLLDNQKEILKEHILEALSYRPQDKFMGV